MSYKTLENQMICVINSLPSGKEFCLNEIIENPPAQLGRTLYQYVQSGKISNVVCITPDKSSIQKYRKC